MMQVRSIHRSKLILEILLDVQQLLNALAMMRRSRFMVLKILSAITESTPELFKQIRQS